MVTICTASLTFNKPTFCPHSVFVCFVWIWEQTAIISLYSNNWLVCITETESVYCAVRTESLNMKQADVLRRFVAGLSPRGSLSIADQSMWDVWWTAWHWEQVSLRVRISVFPVSIIPLIPRTYPPLPVALTKRKEGQSLETFLEAMTWQKSGRFGWKNTVTLSSKS